MPYIIPFLVMLPALFSPRFLKLSIFIVFIVLSIIGGIRYDVGFDYLKYIEIFESDYLFAEPLSNLIFRITRQLDSVYLMFLFFSILTYAFVCLAAINVNRYWVLFSYLCLPFYFVESFGLLRQSVSVAICVYAYSLEDSKKRGSYFFIVVACLFHLSAVVYLFSRVFYKFIGKIPLVIIFLFSVICIFFTYYLYEYVQVFYGKLAFYSGQNAYGMKMFFLCLMLLLFSLIFPVKKESKYLFTIAFYFSFLSVVIDAVFIRFVSYFFIPLLFINWGESINKDFKYFAAFFYFLLFLISLYIKSNVSQGALLPYDTIFSNGVLSDK